MKGKKQKVVVALSGGVDSAVATALLLEEGYEVIGAFMKNWSRGKSLRGVCNWKEERRDALRVAAHQGIPLITFDFEKEYREQVADYLFKEYAEGRTPNPDVLCNSEVKFPLLWREAQKLGADLIATGHHVRKSPDLNFSADRPKNCDGKNGYKSGWLLAAGKDKNKDQSYFLHRLTQEDLSHTLFPIGDHTKEEVRALARGRGIPVADKRSTRGICFIGKVPLPEFLQQEISTRPGPVVTTRGAVIGEHRGLAPFTIGQRHGFGIGGGGPYYVVGKDTLSNTLVVGEGDDNALWRREIRICGMHWMGPAPKLPFRCRARIRYRGTLQSVTIYDENGLKAEFDTPVWAPAAGQYFVAYSGELCLGGAVIQEEYESHPLHNHDSKRLRGQGRQQRVFCV